MPDLPRFEDISEGWEVPPVTRQVTLLEHITYMQASRAVGLMHFDREYARGVGLPDIILAGHMRISFMAQLITDWVGENGFLRRISARQKAVDIPGHPLVVRAVITKKYTDGDDQLVDLDVWTENEQGERTCEGTATAVLPRA